MTEPLSRLNGGDAGPWAPASNTSAWARYFGMALVAAILCNGIGVYMRKVGLLETIDHHAYWAWHCGQVAELGPLQRAQPGCCAHASADELAVMRSAPRREVEQTLARYIFEMAPAEKALKLFKDAFGLAFVAASCWLMTRQALLRPHFKPGSWGLPSLLVYGSAMFGLSWAWHGLLVPSLGLRPLLLLAVFWVGAWMAPHLAGLARFVALALALQLLLIPLELWAGIHLNGHGHQVHLGWLDLHLLLSRASGTLVLPNSLGVFAVTGLAFCHAFAPSRGRLLTLTALATSLIYFSGSGVGALALLLFLLIVAWRAVPVHQRGWLAAGAVVLAGLLGAVLPDLLGRPDIMDSVLGESGRFDTFKQTVLNQNALHFWLGQGLGVNTNLALNLDLAARQAATGGTTAGALRYTDSTLTALMIQLGVVGTILFYGLLLWAARRDTVARPFYAVLALCSLTLNITELFPVNFLLGLALAHSALDSMPVDKWRANA